MSDPERPIRVLVIDDEEVVHASLRKILSRQGYQVDATLSAPAGLERLGADRYDLVITDLMMPGMNGIELLGEMRARELFTPVLMITGYPTIRTAVQAMRLGAVDYLAKPFTRKELLGPVKRALRIEVGEDRAGAAEIDPGSLVPGVELFLPHHAWARFEQDGTFLVGLEASFLRAAGRVRAILAPEEAEVVEQGYLAIRLENEEGEEHGVAMPLSGQVEEVNRELLADPTRLEAGSWLLRILPSQLASELGLLIPR
jgi:DNA-binding response OmpR family regulator